MDLQATQGIESAIVLASVNSSPEKYDSSLELAFRASIPALLAVPKDKLQSVNVDVRRAVCLGLAATERLQSWRARILDELPRFDINALDRLEQYAKALMHAQVEYTLARKSPADVRALTEATQRLYQVLMNDARALAGRGFIAPERLEKLTGCRRRTDRALALTALVNVLKTAWPRIEGKTALTLAELAAADDQAVQLMLALAHQKKPLRDLAEVAELRQRAFTVFANAYSQARRAIQYLCENEREAEQIIPSLYPRKRATRKAPSTPPEVAPVAESSQPAQPPASKPYQTAAPITTTALGDTGATFASARAEVDIGPLAQAAPQQPSRSNALSETAAKQRKTKRRRPTKRERFLRSLGITVAEETALVQSRRRAPA